LSRPFSLEFIEQRRFHHGSASSQNLEQSWIMNVKVLLRLPLSPHLDQPVRQPSRLDQLCRQWPPGDEVAHSGQPQDRITVMLDQPLTALVVLVVHRSSRLGAGCAAVAEGSYHGRKSPSRARSSR